MKRLWSLYIHCMYSSVFTVALMHFFLLLEKKKPKHSVETESHFNKFFVYDNRLNTIPPPGGESAVGE